MARTKKTASSPTKASAVKKARVLQSATENTRSTRHRFAIPPAAFGRVARGIIVYHGHSLDIGKISPKALAALQRFTEASIVDHIDKARMIMGADDTDKQRKKTLTVRHLKIADKAFSVTPGARLELM